MKKYLSVILAVALVVTLSTGTAFAGQGHGSDKGKKEFKDMKGHWGYQSVYKMQNYGIFNGYEDGTFKPDNTLTEAELAVLIERIVDYKLGDDADDDKIVFLNTGGYNNYGWGSGYNWGSWGGWGTWKNQNFYNVPAWAQKAVWRGAYNNYFNPNTFNPTLQTSRVTAIVAIAKALGLEPEPVYTYNPFSDGRLIADEDLGYVLAMYNEGYISGYPDGSFNPNATLTRAQMATIIEKLLEDGIDLGDDEDNDDEDAPTWASKSKIEAVKIKAESVELKWTAASDDVKVTGYKVIYEVNGKEMTKKVTGKTVTISGLEPDEEYTFTVEARDAAGNWSDDGPSVDVTTAEDDEDDEDDDEDTEDPYWDDDSKIEATSIGTNSVALKWSAAEDDVEVVGYKVFYEVDGKEKSKSATGRNVTIKDLEPDTEYTFTVEAKDAAGNWSNDGPSVDVTTDEEEEDTKAPTWPTGAVLQISPSSSGVTLIWPDASDNVGVESYKIYLDGELIKTVDEDTNSYIVTGLDEDTEYTFKVKALDEAGNASSYLTKTYLTDLETV